MEQHTIHHSLRETNSCQQQFCVGEIREQVLENKAASKDWGFQT